jgi:hypothetical protein
MAIITGEFDLDDMMETGFKVFGDKEIIYTLFLIFIIFTFNIVLMNVFTALAVGDVNRVMKRVINWKK